MKLKVHIDKKAFTEKPSGKEIAGIKSRLQKSTIPSLLTLEELVQVIKTGHTISPGIMRGMSAKDWTEQQIFLVDIDNEEDGPILHFKDAKAICSEYGLKPAFYYQTFGYAKEHPKFRLAFVMDKPITDESARKHIIETLVQLFPQSDKSCVNADRIFHGTNKKVILLNENARISCEKVELARSHIHDEKSRYGHSSHTRGRTDSELDELIQKFDLFGYLQERNGSYRITEKGVVFENCEICGHHDNLMYIKDTNSFSCRSKEVGGSIIDYLIHAEGLTTTEAIHKLKHELAISNWTQPLPLEDFKLPSFPVDMLPSPLDGWVTSVAESTQTPVDMAAVCALAVLSCAVQGKYRIAQNSSHSEPLNLYILIIAKSGERKSSIVRIMTRVIHQYEDEENKRRQSIIEKEDAQLNVLKKQLDQREKSGKAEKTIQLRFQCRELENHRTKFLRLLADDVTPEALTSLLADNQGILTIISTEGGLFDTLGGRYSNVVSIDTILKAYTGDRIQVDRKGRESECIKSPALTILLSAQDNVLEGLMENEVFKSRGLPARILFCRPMSKMGTRRFDSPELSKDLEQKYVHLLRTLLNIPLPVDSAPATLGLSEKAYQRAKQFFDWLEPRLVDEFEGINDWAGKFFGNMLRIAGLLHCTQHAKSPAEKSISQDTVQRAIKISMYFLEHAQYAYAQMGADKVLHGAKVILKQLETQNKRELTKYQIYRLCRCKFLRVEDTVHPIELLIEHGYLKEVSYPAPTGGRPRANGYLLNPKYFTTIS